MPNTERAVKVGIVRDEQGYLVKGPDLQAMATSARSGPSALGSPILSLATSHVSSAKRNPYEVLGVTPDIGNDALKVHYRKLVIDNHPDKMIARGVPPEFVTTATKKIAAISAAYEAVARKRRI